MQGEGIKRLPSPDTNAHEKALLEAKCGNESHRRTRPKGPVENGKKVAS